ncbi:minor capsid protein [Marinilactibacillus psychrotolerans]|nr:minor capsid protein [Marinilactibacillus psychrotolerans]
MNRKEYWEKRQTQLFNAQDKQDAKLTERMRKEYERTAKAIDKDIASYYAKYAKDDVIEYRKLVVGLDKKEKDLLYQDVEKFVKKRPEHADLMPVRKSVYKLNRLEGLQLSARQRLLELGSIEQSEFDNALKDSYERGYLSSMEGLENKEAFFRVDDKVMQATLNAGWIDGANYSDRIWSNKDKLIKTLNNEIRDGLVRGESYKSMIDILQNRTEVGKSDTKRLVFTESAHILNEANAQAFQDAGIKKYELTAVLDSKTSPTCRNIDGQQFLFSQRVVGINAPPFHPYCRTTQIPVENSEIVDDLKTLDDSATHKELRENGKALADRIKNDTDIEKRAKELDNKYKQLEELRKDYKNDKFSAIRTKALTENRYDLDDGLINAKEFNKRQDEITQKYSREKLSNQIRTLSGEITSLESDNALKNAEDIKNILSSVRPMGIGDIDLKGHLVKPASATSKQIKNAYDYLPTDWIKKSVDYGELKPKKVRRAYYKHATKEIGVSAGDSFRTSLHELTHRQEHVNPTIIKLEKEFYDMRTKGEKTQSLKSLLGGVYDKKEITKVDNFINPYMGKDYDGRVYELMTMGVDTLYTNPVDLMKDEEMFEWVLGMLTVK